LEKSINYILARGDKLRRRLSIISLLRQSCQSSRWKSIIRWVPQERNTPVFWFALILG